MSDPEVFRQEIESWSIENRSAIVSSVNALKTNMAYHKNDSNFWSFLNNIFRSSVHFGKQEIHLHLPDSKSFFGPIGGVVDSAENPTFNNNPKS